MRGAVRRVLFSFVILATVGAIAALVARVGFGAGPLGCVLRSVDKREYVARNEAILRTIPVPRGYRKINAYSVGIPSPDACIPWHENGPPYSAYNTWHVYEGRGPAGGFYAHALRRNWQWVGGDATYQRGLAVLYVSGFENGFSLSIDYKGGAGRGH
jgi:hypothetical protein